MERVLWVTLRDKGPSSWSMWFPELFMEKMVLKLCILLGVPFLPLQPSLAQSPWPITQRGHNFPLYHSLWLFSSPLIFLSYNQRLGLFFFERSIPLLSLSEAVLHSRVWAGGPSQMKQDLLSAHPKLQNFTQFSLFQKRSNSLLDSLGRNPDSFMPALLAKWMVLDSPQWAQGLGWRPWRKERRSSWLSKCKDPMWWMFFY